MESLNITRENLVKDKQIIGNVPYIDAFSKGIIQTYNVVPAYRRTLEIPFTSDWSYGGNTRIEIKSNNILHNFRIIGQTKVLRTDGSNYAILQPGSGMHNLLSNYEFHIGNRKTFVSYGTTDAILNNALISQNLKSGMQDMTLSSTSYTTAGTAFESAQEFSIPLTTVVDGAPFLKTDYSQALDMRKVDNNTVFFELNFSQQSRLFTTTGTAPNISSPFNSLYLQYDEIVSDPSLMDPEFQKQINESGEIYNRSYNLQYYSSSYTAITSGVTHNFSVSLDNINNMSDGIIFYIGEKTNEDIASVVPQAGVSNFELTNNGVQIDRVGRYATQSNRLRMLNWLDYFPDNEKVFVAQPSFTSDVKDVDSYIQTRGMSGLTLDVSFTAPATKNYRVVAISLGKSRLVYKDREILYYA